MEPSSTTLHVIAQFWTLNYFGIYVNDVIMQCMIPSVELKAKALLVIV